MRRRVIQFLMVAMQTVSDFDIAIGEFDDVKNVRMLQNLSLNDKPIKSISLTKLLAKLGELLDVLHLFDIVIERNDLK